MAGLKFGFNFNGAWSARIDPMIEAKVQGFKRHPMVAEFLDGVEGVNSVDDLSNRQRARLYVSFMLLRELVKFEGGTAAEAARNAAADDVVQNFPLEVGDE